MKEEGVAYPRQIDAYFGYCGFRRSLRCSSYLETEGLSNNHDPTYGDN
jgi:hypothetical protein